MSEKICPVIMAAAISAVKPLGVPEMRKIVGIIETVYTCRQSRCEWWCYRPYSTERLAQDGCCAIRLQAITNSDGLIVV